MTVRSVLAEVIDSIPNIGPEVRARWLADIGAEEPEALNGVTSSGAEDPSVAPPVDLSAVSSDDLEAELERRSEAQAAVDASDAGNSAADVSPSSTSEAGSVPPVAPPSY
jgi:hypothetical protein